MKPVIKFIQDNLVPVICGAVVLLGLIAWLVWPLPGWKADLQTTMQTRYGQIAQANNLITNITIPGGQTLVKATYEPNVIAAAENAQKDMARQAVKVVKSAAEQNREGRVKIINGHTIPYLGKNPEDYYLPAIDPARGQPYRFKVEYERQFGIWASDLVGSKNNEPGIPPSATDLQADLTAEHARAAAPVAGNPMFANGAGSAGATDPNEILRYERNALSRRAADIKMYVDPLPFQTRPWYGTPTPPDAPQIFDALIDCWFQNDVVNAILETNKGCPNVGASHIKRLEKITVGVAPSSAGGGTTTDIFFTATAGAAASGMAAPVAGPTTVDLTRSMTGRLSNSQYDVVLMNISIDLDPAYENAFIAALYRQNNGYTVLNINTKTIDPFDATGNGYLYGNVQVVHVDILVEGLLFRSWTLPIMPDATKTLLGIPTTPTPPAGTPAT